MKRIKSLLYPFLQRLRYMPLLRKVKKAEKQPLKKGTLFMLSTSKGRLGGNLKAIAEYVEKNGLPYTPVICTAEHKLSETELAEQLATAEYILVDDYEPMVYPLKLREGQKLIQVWHALGAFKKFGYARETAEQNSLTHKNYTAAICSSPELVPLYAESFGIDEEKVKPVGAPRTDLFFDEAYKAAARARLYEKAPALKGKRVVLFAPTFRGNSVNDGCYPAEWFDAAALAEQLGEGYAVIVKRHPFIKNELNTAHPRVFDFSDEREINDILLLTDVLVTDYSSVIFENAIIGGACVHYVPDLAEYEKGRGFYFPYADYVCGEVVSSQSALADAIRSASADDERMKRFKARFVSLCDGQSCARFVKEVLEAEK